MKKWKKRNPFGKKFPHCNEAHNYSLDVLKGKIVACKTTIQACERYHRDLLDKRFEMKVTKAERALMICSLLPHTKGELAGQNITFEPWQKFQFLNIFGFYKKKDGYRRFTRVYEEVARKNGKSLKLSAIAILMTFCDGEEGAEGYSAATKEDQAKIVWGDAKTMLQKRPELCKRLGIRLAAKSIFCEKTNSSYKFVGSDSKTQDGYNPHFTVLDELHAHKNSGIYDVFETALGARRQPLLYSITTAGFNLTGICYQNREEAIKILNQDIYDESLFCMIFTLDDGDDYTDPKVWIKANPNLDVSVSREYLQKQVLSSQNIVSRKSNVLTKNFNIWVAGGSSFINMDEYAKCKDDFTLDDFEDDEVILGVDLSSKVDMSDVAWVARRFIDGEYHYYADVYSYLPADTLKQYLKQRKNNVFEQWVNEGWLTETQGATIDYEILKNDCLDIARKTNLKELGFDPWGATMFARDLEKENVETCEVPQRVSTFSEPLKEFEKLVKDRRFHHRGNPVLSWGTSNVQVTVDKNENIYPFKKSKEDKIDPFIAVLIALVRWFYFEEEEESQYNDGEDLLIF